MVTIVVPARWRMAVAATSVVVVTVSGGFEGQRLCVGAPARRSPRRWRHVRLRA
ncbi:hypothetical protein ACFONL_02240 [Camelimonas fluminis]|uniref:Uncharacterized protein n=1 Tax=Camelimonas fluminis TaxID=1576911 RepID=A0ABV7UCH9_9HYPH|nr:hypothetical protein [Camelimonas fluminis]